MMYNEHVLRWKMQVLVAYMMYTEDMFYDEKGLCKIHQNVLLYLWPSPT